MKQNKKEEKIKWVENYFKDKNNCSIMLTPCGDYARIRLSNPLPSPIGRYLPS